MIEKINAPNKYMSNLRNQVKKEPNSISLNAQISTFLINQGRVKDAIPFLVKMLDLIMADDELNEVFKQAQENQSIKPEINRKFRVVDRATAIGEEVEKEIADLVKEKIERESQLSINTYTLKDLFKGKNVLGFASEQQQNNPVRSYAVTRKIGEKIVIDDSIEIRIADVGDRSARLKVQLPNNNTIHYTNDYELIANSNQQAINTDIQKFKSIIKDKQIIPKIKFKPIV